MRILYARWLIGDGQLDEARRLLDLTEGEEARLWFPTRWLLARALKEDLEPWATAYEAVRAPQGVNIDAVLPRSR